MYLEKYKNGELEELKVTSTLLDYKYEMERYESFRVAQCPADNVISLIKIGRRLHIGLPVVYFNEPEKTLEILDEEVDEIVDLELEIKKARETFGRIIEGTSIKEVADEISACYEEAITEIAQSFINKYGAKDIKAMGYWGRFRLFREFTEEQMTPEVYKSINEKVLNIVFDG